MSRYRKEILASLLLAGITLAAYVGVLSCDFVSLDDDIYVTGNRQVLAGLTPAGLVYAWTTSDGGFWFPLTWMSLELDGTLYGSWPGGYHATNLAWHIANVVLLFWVLRRMTASFWRSALVAALFALHPLHVESVAWVTERKDVLSTFFLLLSLAAYERYAARPSLLRHLMVVVAMALGLMAKPMLVTLPFLLLLLDYWPLRRLTFGTPRGGTDAEDNGNPVVPAHRPVSLRSLVWEKSSLFALAVAFAVTTFVTQKAAGAVASVESIPKETRVANALVSYAWYLGKTVWPTDLAVFYPHPRLSLSWLHVAGAILLLLTISACVVRAARQRPHLAVGWLWFLGSLVPVIGLVQAGLQAHADRFVYVPHIGLLALIVWELHYWLVRDRAGRVLFASLATVLVVACGLLTRVQVAYWHTNESLWEHAIEVTGSNWMADGHLGLVRLQQGRLAEAEGHFAGVLRERPDHAEAHNGLGWVLVGQEKLPEAEQHFAAAIRSNPRHSRALRSLAMLLKKQGRLKEAEPIYTMLIQLLPNDARPHDSLGLILVEQKRWQEAIDQFSAALQIDPEFAAAHYHLASALSQSGRPVEALPPLDRALRINPKLADAHYLKGTLLEDQKEFEQAREEYAAAIHIRPNHTEAENRLRRLLAR